ncbi:hypothetical protein BJ165DRAFT_1479067, partial [Panaeolus papilionaceus]
MMRQRIKIGTRERKEDDDDLLWATQHPQNSSAISNLSPEGIPHLKKERQKGEKISGKTDKLNEPAHLNTPSH